MNILGKIIDVKNDEVQTLRKKFSIKSFEDFYFFSNNNYDFKTSISKHGQINLIAEIKKASPSKGILRENFNHKEITRIYFQNSVAAVSILTDKNFFKGNITYLSDIAAEKKAPLLRKEFIVDEIQIYESKANGADAILLIAEILSAQQIKEYTCAANEINLDVLLEIHSPKQLDKIDFTINPIIGINNRNLETFSVSLNNTFEVISHLPKNCIVVSESGIKSKSDIDRLKQNKVNACLVGEYFMSSKNIAETIKEFQGWCKNES